MSGFEAGAEFGLMHSQSSTSIATPTSAIPPSHQLTSASPFVDSGIDLNVLGQFNACQASIDEDEVFIVDKNGTPFHLHSFHKALSSWTFSFFTCRCTSENCGTHKIIDCSEKWFDTIAPQSFFVGRHKIGFVQGKCHQKKVQRPCFVWNGALKIDVKISSLTPIATGLG